jgi:hypothetical protein
LICPPETARLIVALPGGSEVIDVRARPLLLYTYGFHSQWLVARGRYKEAALYADRVIEAAHQEELPSEWQRAIMTAAHCAVYSSGQPRPSRGIEMLLDWQPLVKGPVFEAWLLSDIAKYQAQDGRRRPALDTIARSCRVALYCENHIELRLRRVHRAELLLQTGQPNDTQLALDLLPPDGSLNPPQRLREELCWSAGLLQVGEVSEAQRRLDRAALEVSTYNLDGRGWQNWRGTSDNALASDGSGESPAVIGLPKSGKSKM